MSDRNHVTTHDVFLASLGAFSGLRHQFIEQRGLFPPLSGKERSLFLQFRSSGGQFPVRLRKFFIDRLRLYVMAENLFTFTKYHGFDPEISSGGTSLGVDYGVYPQARTWTVGFNLSF